MLARVDRSLNEVLVKHAVVTESNKVRAPGALRGMPQGDSRHLTRCTGTHCSPLLLRRMCWWRHFVPWRNC
jgi:hypothetical protein